MKTTPESILFFNFVKKTMKRKFTKILAIVFTVLLGNSFSGISQTWTTGIPVPNTRILELEYNGAALPGCYPNSTVTWNFSMPAVTGVNYYGIVDSVDSNSTYLLPFFDTLNVGDTINIFTGSNFIEVYYYGASLNPGNLVLSIQAKGTPTVAGEVYPCNLPDPYFWMCTFSLCPSNCTTTLPTSCTVQLNTGINSISGKNMQVIYPSVENNFTLRFKDANQKKSVFIYDISGKEVYSGSGITEGNIDCSKFQSGMYFLNVTTDEGVSSSLKFNIIRD